MASSPRKDAIFYLGLNPHNFILGIRTYFCLVFFLQCDQMMA